MQSYYTLIALDLANERSREAQRRQMLDIARASDPEHKGSIRRSTAAFVATLSRASGRLARRLEAAVRKLGEDAVPVPHRGGLEGIAGRIVAYAEAVKDDEKDGQLPAASPAARTMAANASAWSEAPPTSAPSMSGCRKKPPALSAVTLPPY